MGIETDTRMLAVLCVLGFGLTTCLGLCGPAEAPRPPAPNAAARRNGERIERRTRAAAQCAGMAPLQRLQCRLDANK